MNLKQTVKYVFILFSFLTALSVQAETKKLYGVEGPKLMYRPLSNTTQTYQVKGEVYTTRTHQDAKDYSKEGVASYYHNKFNGRRTTSGEPYNSTLFTAAHKTLPLNSYAVVTNMSNQRKVIVRINDRGPFSKERIIDLSHAAAKEIGIIGSGMGMVKIEALHVDSKGELSGAGASTLVKNSNNDESLKRLPVDDLDIDKEALQNVKVPHIQDESYELRMINLASKKHAEEVINQLALKNIKAEIAANGQKYNIHLGPLNSKAQVTDLKTQLKRLNHSEPLVVYSYNK
ncbi:septal ring lytic transglycosylase RlpA family protein [uncultured Aggregatibacter sp.]|uniref:septal ring lytic transglycosylase RlpA family protein n=1 Tax=uncultured Aggregatibacter sp. TaxID=470564 RepID=UPI0025980B83|nr:septal ring lytic transglycosylase RlpA family protein [uncultured Aggregatibacter sp.]